MAMAVRSYPKYDPDVSMTELSKRTLVEAIEEEADDKEIEELLVAKADPFATMQGEQTAMHEACRAGKSSIVTLFFTHILDQEKRIKLISTKNTFGETPFHLLGMKDCEDITKIKDCSTIALKMITISLDVLFIKDELGSPPLHELISNGKIDVVLTMLQEIDKKKTIDDKIYAEVLVPTLSIWAPLPIIQFTFEYMSITAKTFVNLTNSDDENLIAHASEKNVEPDKIKQIEEYNRTHA